MVAPASLKSFTRKRITYQVIIYFLYFTFLYLVEFFDSEQQVSNVYLFGIQLSGSRFTAYVSGGTRLIRMFFNVLLL